VGENPGDLKGWIVWTVKDRRKDVFLFSFFFFNKLALFHNYKHQHAGKALSAWDL
jgi:hypothetical protein